MSKQLREPFDYQRVYITTGLRNVRTIFRDDDSLIGSMEEYIRLNIHESVDMNSMAEYYCVSHRTLSRRLRSMGLTFRDVKARVLREVSIEMLVHGDSRIEQIAILTGYQNASNYVKAFKRLMGVSPSYYRKSLAKSQDPLRQKITSCT